MLAVVWQADFDPAGIVTETGWAQLDTLQSAIVGLGRETVILHECIRPQSIVTAQLLARGLGLPRPRYLEATDYSCKDVAREFSLDSASLPSGFGRLLTLRYLWRQYRLVILVTAGSRLTLLPDDLADLSWIQRTEWLACRQTFSDKYTLKSPPYCRGFSLDFAFDAPREFPFT